MIEPVATTDDTDKLPESAPPPRLTFRLLDEDKDFELLECLSTLSPPSAELREQARRDSLRPVSVKPLDIRLADVEEIDDEDTDVDDPD